MPRSRQDFVRIAVLAIFYAGFSVLGREAALVSAETAFGWSSAGIAIGALTAFSCRLWPGVVIGTLGAAALADFPMGAAVIVAVGNTLAAMTGALTFRYFGFDPKLERIRDVIGMAAIAIPISGVPSAILAIPALSIAGTELANSLWLSGVLWLDGSIMSGLIFVPLIVSWGCQWGEPLHSQRPFELSALAILATAVVVVESWPTIPYATQMGIVTTTFALVVWAALRFGVRVTTAITATIVIVAIGGSANGLGPLKFLDHPSQWAALNFFTPFYVVTALALSSIVTARNRSEQELKASERRLRDIASSASDFFWETDVNLHVTYVSERLGDIFGDAGKQLIGKPAMNHDLGEVDPEDLMGLIDTMTDREAYRNHEISITTEDGLKRVFHLSGTPIFDDAGEFQGYRGTGTEITQHRAAEEQLFQAQKMETVGQLTGGVAHDFNNLLAVIMGNLELVDEAIGDNRRARETLLRAFSAAERGATLIQRLLAFSRRQALAPKVVDINSLISGLAVMLRRTLGESFSVREDLQKDLWLVKVDPAQLETAVLNLALNARDAMATGGEIVIESRNAVISRDEASGDDPVEPGEYVSVAVRDVGSGMAPDVLQRIFEPFFTTKDVGSGSGLGLSMVYGFVRQSGGRVEAVSTQGAGTTMTLYLPSLDAQDLPQISAEPVELEMRGRGERILLVEDDDGVREMTYRLLVAMGYDVLAAEDGYAALALIEEGAKIDLLLTDVMLPGGVNGDVLAREIQRSHPGLITLFMSGYPKTAMERFASIGEETHLLQKPFQKQDLARRLRELLDREHRAEPATLDESAQSA